MCGPLHTQNGGRAEQGAWQTCGKFYPAPFAFYCSKTVEKFCHNFAKFFTILLVFIYRNLVGFRNNENLGKIICFCRWENVFIHFLKGNFDFLNCYDSKYKHIANSIIFLVLSFSF